ncbi:MAG: periplasmic heavy metal sensor [Pseudomonadota bacterium]
MAKYWLTKTVVIGVAVMMMGMSVNAIAGMGRGGMGGGGMWGINSSNLTDDQISQLESEQKAFMESTQDLRQQLREKTMSLRFEQSKKAPDAAKIASLQNDLTALRSEFDQKRQAHLSAMKQVDPNFTEGRGRGAGMGRGYCMSN